MKVLFINLPYYSHVIPTIGLVKELIKLGCTVTYLMPYGWEEIISRSGADFVGYENNLKLSEQIRNALSKGEDIIRQFDLVIYEQFFFMGKHLAEKFNKPVVRIFTAPVTNDKLMKEFIAAGGPLGIFAHPWIGRLWTKKIAGDYSLIRDNWLDEIIHNPTDLNLVYTIEEFQPYIESFPRDQFKFLGPSIYDREEEIFHLPKIQGPLIYISLGTVVKGGRKFFQRCYANFENENVTVIMSIGKNISIDQLGKAPSNIHVYQRVPQTEVLKEADIFITHGGMNSVSEALVYGVPMIVIPFMADQPTNANRIASLGLGKRMDYKSIDSSNLRSAVYSILNDTDMINHCNEMKDCMSKAAGNCGGARMIIDYYEAKIDKLK